MPRQVRFDCQLHDITWNEFVPFSLELIYYLAGRENISWPSFFVVPAVMFAAMFAKLGGPLHAFKLEPRVGTELAVKNPT
jgi:hypothetical protein